MRMIEAHSLTLDARQAPPEMIVLHYTGMETAEAALERLRDPAARVSSHYMVEEDGRVFSLVDEARRALHPGASPGKGRTPIHGRPNCGGLRHPGPALVYPALPP